MPVPHILQRRTWDCGLACTASVLAYLQQPVPLSTLFVEVPIQSIWTVDLFAYLFERGVDVSFTTTTLGVSPAHAGTPFYKALAVDSVRVNALFARYAGPRITAASVPVEGVAAAICAGAVVLALVDRRFMHCEQCGCTCVSTEYAGHYVVVDGYDEARGVFSYMDPGVLAARCTISSAMFDTARRAPGTDEDLLFIRPG